VWEAHTHWQLKEISLEFNLVCRPKKNHTHTPNIASKDVRRQYAHSQGPGHKTQNGTEQNRTEPRGTEDDRTQNPQPSWQHWADILIKINLINTLFALFAFACYPISICHSYSLVCGMNVSHMKPNINMIYSTCIYPSHWMGRLNSNRDKSKNILFNLKISKTYSKQIKIYFHGVL